MSAKDEQLQEIEALASIYPEEITGEFIEEKEKCFHFRCFINQH